MMYDDDNILSISGIQHFVFCRRQWALIHIEQQWAENLLTVSGEIMHEKAHDDTFTETRNGIITSRGMQVSSYELGIYGVCDIVEFVPSDDGAILFGKEGKYSVVPVEYKHGEPKESHADILQVAAQAMCLEEMFSTEITEGAIFYGETRRREPVEFTEELRCEVRKIFEEMHEYYKKNYTPKVKPTKACSSCSLKEICMPKLEKAGSVKAYVQKVLEDAE